MISEDEMGNNFGEVYELFGLTYSSYLVWPRLFMQAMPDEWQERFAELCHEYQEKIGQLEPDVNYYVRLPRRRAEEYYQAWECTACGGGEDDCDRCGGSGEDPEEYDIRVETPEEIGFTNDWRSNYRHGRRTLLSKIKGYENGAE